MIDAGVQAHEPGIIPPGYDERIVIRVAVSTRLYPCHAFERDIALVERDVIRGYYTREQAEKLFGVVFTADGSAIDTAATTARRS